MRVGLRTAALLAVLLACALPAASRASTLRIGGLVSETGSGAPYGLSELKGLRLAVRVLNGQKPRGVPQLRLRTRNDRSDPATAEAGARRLMASGANVLLAPTLSPVAAAVGPIARQAGIGFIGVTTTTLELKAIGPVAYRIALTENRLVPATMSLLRRRGVRNAAHPQAILLALRSTEASESLIAARRAGTRAALAGGNGFNTASVIKAAGSAANGLITAAPWNPMIGTSASHAFVAAYLRSYHKAPDAQAALGFATIELLRDAAAIGGTSRAGVLHGLRRLPPEMTVLGRVRFVAHEARYAPVVQQVRRGRFVLVRS